MQLSTRQLKDDNWTLFLDRDGVINRRIPGNYVQSPNEFIFLEGVLSAIKVFSTIFERIIIVTNQQGIGKGIMTVEQLHGIHYHMISEIQKAGGHIANTYFCPTLASKAESCRKPSGKMAQWAQHDFPNIDFTRSIMIGDMPSDIQFGNDLSMTTIHVDGDSGIVDTEADYRYHNLDEIARDLLNGGLE